VLYQLDDDPLGANSQSGNPGGTLATSLTVTLFAGPIAIFTEAMN